MARFLDLSFELLLMIIDLVFLDINCEIQVFDGILLEVRRPSRALLQTCRTFHKLGKDRIHQVTAVEIGYRDKPIFFEHFAHSKKWKGAAQLLKQCPDRAKTLTLRYVVDHRFVRNICRNMKGLETVHWITGQTYQSLGPAQPVNSTLGDILAGIGDRSPYLHDKKRYQAAVGKIPSLELTLTIQRSLICPNYPPIPRHYVEGEFLVRLGASETILRLKNDGLCDFTYGCDCFKTPSST